jgi:type II secretory pathway pseudopilin PulG
LQNGWDNKPLIENQTKNQPRKPSEDGYMLIAVVFMLALFVIALAVAAPRVARSIQREREIETMHRGKQYIRAVKLYYRKFGRYPPNVDALVNTNEIRFLRKKYVDPTTGKEDWKPIPVGMNKTQSTGFFGQPILGSGAATGLTGSPGMAGTLGGQSPSGSAFGNSNTTPGSSSSSLFSSSSTSTPSSTAPGSTTDPSASASGSSTPTTDANGNPIPPGSSSSTSSTTGSAFGSGPTLGGLGVMGFSPNSPKLSILVWHKKSHYNEWEFFYDPQADLTMLGSSAGAVGQPAGSTPVGTGPGVGNGPGTSGSSFGNSSSTFGNSSNSFGSGSTSAPPTSSPQPSPQQ